MMGWMRGGGAERFDRLGGGGGVLGEKRAVFVLARDMNTSGYF